MIDPLLSAPVTQESVVVRLKQFVMARFFGGLGTATKSDLNSKMISVMKASFFRQTYEYDAQRNFTGKDSHGDSLECQQYLGKKQTK